MTRNTENPSGFMKTLSENLGLVTSMIGVAVQVVVMVWFIAGLDARTSHNSETLTTMLSHNVPSRLQTVEDSTISMQRDIATLQAEIRNINTGLADQRDSLAAITAKLDFMIDQIYPRGAERPHRGVQ